MATTDSSERLQMHVLGGHQGESIILGLPNGRWGVIDCYSSSLADPARNPTCRFLEERGVQDIEFLGLTHPHEDHFRGMSHLLERFGVRYFWRPDTMSGRRLRWILKSAWADPEWDEEIPTARELFNIFRLVKESRDERQEPLIPKDAVLGTMLYPVPIDRNAHFQVWAIGPSTRQKDRYEEDLAKCFDDQGRLLDRLPTAHHNRISMALLIIFGKTRIILGADTEEANWSDTLEEYGSKNLAATAVKISHHGSTNGYCQGLWTAFAQETPPHAVCTPFGRFKLPAKTALNHIRAHAGRILTPHLPAVTSDDPPVPLSPAAPVASRKAMHDRLRARARLRTPTHGCCSLIFDDTGNCVDEQFTESAGEIP